MASDAVDRASEPEEITKALSGSDRVLATLNLLGSFPNGVGLNDLARLLELAALERPSRACCCFAGPIYRARSGQSLPAGLWAVEAGRSPTTTSSTTWYESVPCCLRSADRFGETAHYAILDGTEVVYLAKVQPAASRYQMNSVIGGRNPALLHGRRQSAACAYTLSAT